MSLTALLLAYVLDRNFLYQLLATLIVLLSIKITLFIRVRQKRYQLFRYYKIPHPETDLIGGNFKVFQKPLLVLKNLHHLQEEYGETFAFFIGDEPGLNTSDLDLLKKVFLENMSSFKERTKLFLSIPLKHSILFASRHRWKVMRKVMSPYFSNHQMRGSESLQFVEDSIKLMLDYIDDKMADSKATNGRIRLDIHDLMKAATLHMISTIAVRLPDVRVKEKDENVKSLDSFLAVADQGVVEWAIKFPFINVFLNFLATHFEYDRTVALIHTSLNRTIDHELARLKSKHRGSPSQTNDKLIDFLVKLHYEGKLTRQEVIGNADAILFAGYDTTSTTLTYVSWILGKYPEIQEKLRDDLMTYGTESIYMEQVINETMRLYPTVISFASRLATETVEINGMTIPQGTKVSYNAWLINRNPKIWPDPLKFDPDRFRPGVEHHPCAFAPFGLGERKCLGYQLARIEMKMILCDLLLRYRIHLVGPDNLELQIHAAALTQPSEKVIIEVEKL